ncbi:sulfatase-like hydrolase/transferase [Halosolutus amylolyticus]|uniref:Sulfatase-like hydrolase/transferase n=1 Tax=Halosolutus amylolyticus TaxID=2932267 RepID=A0ABD5PRV2_9EURY|nr:sulfatase-like hydrolase/transferase [Halosolutus amylolyticus]
MTNIALIVLDTLRKDTFDEHFDWLPGQQFENAWSTSHWTVPAHASLFTGKYASEAGVYRGAQMLDVDEEVLPERFSRAGYTTRAFSANPNISSQFSFDRGFDQFKGSWRLNAMDDNLFDWDVFIEKHREDGASRYLKAIWECVMGDCKTIPSLKRGGLLKLRDLGYGKSTVDDGAQSALELIENTDFGDEEFFFANLMEAHSPYSAPAEYQTVEPPEIRGLEATFTEVNSNPDHIRQAYHDEVRYLSDMYQKMFTELREAFDIIITVSDHGELLGEHDAWEHMYGIYPELTHIPLVVWTGENDAERRSESVNLLDIYRTVLEIADIDPADTRGRDLRTELDDAKCLTEYHGISERHYQSLLNKDIVNIEHLRQELSGFACHKYYYHETFDGYREYGESPYDDPGSHLSDLVSSLEKHYIDEEDDIDDAVLDHLEDLGYA